LRIIPCDYSVCVTKYQQVSSSLGLVRSVTLYPLTIFVIKDLSFSVVVSFLLFECF
jgi:hypothetical protein